MGMEVMSWVGSLMERAMRPDDGQPPGILVFVLLVLGFLYAVTYLCRLGFIHQSDTKLALQSARDAQQWALAGTSSFVTTKVVCASAGLATDLGNGPGVALTNFAEMDGEK